MRIPEIDYEAYARLLIKAGVTLKKGQNLRIRYHVGGSLLARRCAELAYAQGAGIVDLQLRDPHIQKARIVAQAGNDEALGNVPGWTTAWEDSILDEKWAFLALESFDDVGLMSDVDPVAAATFERLQSEKIRRYRDAVVSHAFPWTVCGVPGDAWAERVLGEDKTAEDLWEVLRKILLLDQSDPIAAWTEKVSILHERRKRLGALELDRLHIKDEVTDLKIGLLPESLWNGGGREDGHGVHMPNLPTEEVFTTPDRRRCDGYVRTTRPVEIRGTLIKNAVLEFRDGVVTNFDAEEGREALGAFLYTDPGARRLGEVALVGEDSPIAASGLVFDSILYDENASCHIALGAGYPTCLKNGESLSNQEEKEAAGCNHSLVHRDLMIGSPNTDIDGIDRNGTEHPIMRNGLFVL